MAETGATWGDLKAKMPDDLMGRSDGASIINDCLVEAVEYWQSEIFVAEEAESQWISTVAGQGYVAPPPQVEYAGQLMVDIDGVWIPVDRTDQQEIDRLNAPDPPLIGPPVKYAYFDNQYNFFPVPDNAYPLKQIYREIIPLPATDATTNFWSTIAEALIRHYAVYLAYATKIRGENNGLLDYQLAIRERNRLRKQLGLNEARAKVRAVYL